MFTGSIWICGERAWNPQIAGLTFTSPLRYLQFHHHKWNQGLNHLQLGLWSRAIPLRWPPGSLSHACPPHLLGGSSHRDPLWWIHCRLLHDWWKGRLITQLEGIFPQCFFSPHLPIHPPTQPPSTPFIPPTETQVRLQTTKMRKWEKRLIYEGGTRGVNRR